MFDVVGWTIVVLASGMFLVMAEIVGGLVVRKPLASPRPRRPLVFEWHVLAPIAALIALMIWRSFARGADHGVSLQQIESQILVNFVVIGFVTPLLAATRRNRLRDYGIDCAGWRDEVRAGGLGFLASVVPVLAVLIATAPLRSVETQHPFLKLLGAEGGARATIEITFAAVVAAPLAEELIFRVVLQGVLASLFRPAAAVVLTAFAFAAVHPWPDMLPLFPLAIVLGIVFQIRRSYVAVVTLHALFNAANLILALAAQTLSLP